MASSWQKFEELIKQEMRKMYSEAVVEHSMSPRNLGDLEDANGCGTTIASGSKVNNGKGSVNHTERRAL